MEEVDDDEVLASWKTLDVPDDEHDHHHHVMHGSGISTETDDDAFAALAYDHDARIETPSQPTQPQHHDQQHALVQLSTPQQHDHSTRPHAHAHAQQHQQQRRKRKNFSKQLQLLCLQRYAQFTKTHGKLPDKTECQCLLHQSYLEFLKAGGAPDEPRLTHQEFLKLIRNRRREMYVRAQKGKFAHGSAPSSALSRTKRKLQQEHAKIYELIAVIDQAREQSGLATAPVSAERDHGHRHLYRTSSRPTSTSRSSAAASAERHSSISASASALAAVAVPHSMDVVPPPAPVLPSSGGAAPPQPLRMDPHEQLLAIFELQQETLAVQREIAERLKAIRLHRHLQPPPLDAMEPSSASV